jgi:GNAT superfamily N-acetyltransferase
MTYRVREATLADADTLVRHRIAMFTDMGIPFDAAALDRAFRTWLAAMMPAGTYRAWLVEAEAGDVVAGGGITVLPWPPGPTYSGDRLAFVYNVYTEPAHRRLGLARRLMHAIHAWCREAGIASVALNASRDGVPLYESMGYELASAPMMFFAVAAGYNRPAQDAS